MKRYRPLFLVVWISFVLVFSCAGKREEPPSGAADKGELTRGSSADPASTPTGRKEGTAARAESHGVLFWIDNVPVTVQELKDTASSSLAHGQRSVSPDERFKEQLLRELVANNQLYLEARERRMDGGNLLKYREKMIFDQWLGFHYQTRYLKGRLTASDEEVKRRLPPELEWAKVREIVVEDPNEVAEVYRELASGKPFDAIARERSVSPSAPNGGAISIRFERGSSQLYGASVQEKYFSVPAGTTLPQAIETPMGLAIFRIEERQPYTPEEREDYLRGTRTRILDEKNSVLAENLKARYPMRVHEAALEKAASDPIDHLDLPVAEVGRNTIRFGETYLYYQDTSKGRGNPRELKSKGWRAVLDQQYPALVLREAAAEEGLLNNPLVQENIFRYHKSLVVENLRESLSKKVKVSQEEVEQRYEDLKPVWQKAAVYKLTMVQFPTREAAVEAILRMRKGESLSGLLSPAPHAKGGEPRLPSFTMREDEVPPRFRPTVSHMRKGDVSGPVVVPADGPVPEGYVVIRLDDVERGKVPKLGEARREIEQRIRNEKLQLLTSEIVIRGAKKYTMRDFNKSLFDRAVADWEAETREGAVRGG